MPFQVSLVWQELRILTSCNYCNKVWNLLYYSKPFENAARDGRLAGGILGWFCQRYIPVLIKCRESRSNS